METPTHTAPPFDLDRLVSSSWAKRFRADCPTSYSEAILRAGEPVDIYESDETGELQWVVALEDGFWMDAFTSREEAENLVAEMGWPIIGDSLTSLSTDRSPVFLISSLRDIYNLPTIEQMEICIDEIKICMMQARATNDLFVALANLEGENMNKAFEWPETLPWHDDGKGDVGTRYVTPDGDEFMSMDVQVEARRTPSYSTSAGWESPETAPQDGSQILGYFGYPWPQVAAWNTHDEGCCPPPHCSAFDEWWSNHGSAIRPATDEDQEEHAKRVAASAWIAAVLLPNVQGEARADNATSPHDQTL